MNPECGLTSTLQGDNGGDSFRSSCIHCGADHDVRREAADTGGVAYTVTGLSGKPEGDNQG
jgi:hypothetical protein